jgi:two-component system sensor histidine kinase DesK
MDLGGKLDLPTDLYGRAECAPAGAAGGAARKHNGASYVWLAYSVFFFIEPIARHQARYWLQQMPVYAVFLALYVAYVQFDVRRIRLALIAGMFVLGVAAMPSNVGGSAFLIYVAALLPFSVVSARWMVSAIAVELLTLALEYHVFPENPFNYLITAFFVIVVGASNLFIAQQKQATYALGRAQAENAGLAAVAERERIARDLHDVLGHTLSVIVLKAELAGRLVELDPARAVSEIADVERTARTALAEVREAIGGYRTRGLNAEVEQARQTLSSAGVALSCETRPPVLPAREETVLSLAVREAVTNIVRHAQATQCTMRFATTADGFASFEVADNGSRTIQREGNGLRGMRERVQELGGRFRIEQEAGTTLVIELPR